SVGIIDTRKQLVHPAKVNRLHNPAVKAKVDIVLSTFLAQTGGDCEYRDPRYTILSFDLSYTLGRRSSIHDWHLHVHENNVILGLTRCPFYCGSSPSGKFFHTRQSLSCD